MSIYNSMYDVLPDLSLLTDCAEQVLDINSALAALLGYEHADLVGKSIQSVLGQDNPADGRTPEEDTGEHVRQTARLASLLRKNGSTLACEYTKVPVFTPEGEMKGALYLIHLPRQADRSSGWIVAPHSSRHPKGRGAINSRLAGDMAHLFGLAGLDAVVLWSYIRAEGDFQQEILWGDEFLQKALSDDQGKTVAYRVMETRHAIFINPASEEQYSAITDPVPWAGVACLPFMMQDQVLGVLWFRKRSEFDPVEQQTLLALASLLSRLLRLEQVEEIAQERGDRLDALRKIEVGIKESYDLKVALGVLLDQTVQLLGVDAAGILLLKPDSLDLELIAQRGFRAALLSRMRYRMGQLPPGRVVSDRVRLHIPAIREATPPTEWDTIMAAEGFVGYYGVPLIARGAVKGVLHVFSSSPLYPVPDWEDFLEACAGQAAIAVDKAELFEKWQRSLASLDISYDSTLQGWMRALQLRDRYTSVPEQKVIDKTLELAMVLGIPDQNLVHLRRGVILHDVGKIGIPDQILFKPGPLDEDEWEIMQRHPIFGYEMLSPIPYLKEAVDVPYAHHERWDGQGYPRGLKGTEIPLAARIFSVVDVWAAMTSPRPYRSAIPAQEVRKYIEENAGRHFDPRVVEIFLGLF